MLLGTTSHSSLLLRRSHVSLLPPASALLMRVYGDGGTKAVLEAALLRPAAAALLRDHCVQGRAVVPAAAYLELATAGASILSGMFASTRSERVRPTGLHMC